MERQKRVFGEFVLIVLGVLTALGAEEYMSGRRDAALAEEYRTRLHSELTQDANALQRRAEFFQVVAGHGRETLRWLGATSRGRKRRWLVPSSPPSAGPSRRAPRCISIYRTPGISSSSETSTFGLR